MMTDIELTPKFQSDKGPEARLDECPMLQPLSKRSIELIDRWLHRDSILKDRLNMIFVVSAVLLYFGVFIPGSVNLGPGASLFWLIQIPLGAFMLLMIIVSAFIFSMLVYEPIRFFKLYTADSINIEGGSLADIVRNEQLFSPLCSTRLTTLRIQEAEFPELKTFFQAARIQKRKLFEYEYCMAQHYVEAQRCAKQYTAS